jgi:hypothetical protein
MYVMGGLRDSKLFIPSEGHAGEEFWYDAEIFENLI